MVAKHGFGPLSILCTLGVSCEMNWFCSHSLDCFLEHAKKEHGEFYNDGCKTKFKPEDGFRFCELEIEYEKHSEICEIGRTKAKSYLKNDKSVDELIKDQLRKAAGIIERKFVNYSRKKVEPVVKKKVPKT